MSRRSGTTCPEVLGLARRRRLVCRHDRNAFLIWLGAFFTSTGFASPATIPAETPAGRDAAQRIFATALQLRDQIDDLAPRTGKGDAREQATDTSESVDGEDEALEARRRAILAKLDSMGDLPAGV